MADGGVSRFESGFRIGKGNIEVNTTLVSAEVIPLPLRTRFSRHDRELARRWKSLLFDNSHTIDGLIYWGHPLHGPNPNDLSDDTGLRSLIDRIGCGAVKTVSAEKLQFTELSGSVLIPGGPVSNVYARLVYGVAGNSILLNAPLPVFFDLSQMEESIHSRVETWKLVVHGKIRDIDDCVVITVLPMGDNDWIVSVAGLHSPGGRAVHLVLENEHVLSQLENCKNWNAWQAVISFRCDAEKEPFEIDDVNVYRILTDLTAKRYHFRDQLSLDEKQFCILKRLFKESSTIDTAVQDENLPFSGSCDIFSSEARGTKPTDLAHLDLGREYPHPIAGSRGGPSRGRGLLKTAAGQPGMCDIPLKQRTIYTIDGVRETVRRGRPRKDNPQEDDLKLRRVQLRLSLNDFQRVEKILEVTDAQTIADAVRDSLRIYTDLLDRASIRSR